MSRATTSLSAYLQAPSAPAKTIISTWICGLNSLKKSSAVRYSDRSKDVWSRRLTKVLAAFMRIMRASWWIVQGRMMMDWLWIRSSLSQSRWSWTTMILYTMLSRWTVRLSSWKAILVIPASRTTSLSLRWKPKDAELSICTTTRSILWMKTKLFWCLDAWDSLVIFQ